MTDYESQFRTCLSGFRKADVVEYIQALQAQHQQELREREQTIQDLQKENHSLQQQLDLMMMFSPPKPAPVPDPAPAPEDSGQLMHQELEAYRRAQAAERNANDRARKLYQQMDAVCAEAMEEFRIADGAVNQTLQAVRAQMDTLSEAYCALSAAMEVSRKKLASINGLRLSPEDET